MDAAETTTDAGAGRPAAPHAAAAALSPAPRRRPSGEPPPLPRSLDAGTAVCLAGVALLGIVWAGMAAPAFRDLVTRVDLAVVDAVVSLRNEPTTTIARAVASAGSVAGVRVLAWATLGVLLVARRFQRLVVLLALLLTATAAAAEASVLIGRMRPTGAAILGGWEGYAHPSQPVTALGLALSGALYGLAPAGRWRNRAAVGAGMALAAVCLARVYLAVDHPSDAVAGLVLGVALPVAAFRLVAPDEAFPVTYRVGRRAHLDVGGRRRDAILVAVERQLGVAISEVEPFGLGGSAGSTPLRLTVREGSDGPRCLFGKLYALTHLRSDRWYKLARTVLYGRLEDEQPFQSVRRLVEYEDHMMRLLRDAGVPTARPLGVVELTPEREYLIVTEFLDGAVEIDRAEVDERVVDAALAAVRRMWDAGLAHRDVKPSNVLVRSGDVFLIDVAFGGVRPSPWRQAVDLANMMLTLALRTTPDRVYHRALLQFSPEDVAEAFAATRGVTVPAQLRARLRSDGRDLTRRFRELAPPRPPVGVQRWSVRRVVLTAAVVAGAGLALALLVVNLRIAGLL